MSTQPSFEQLGDIRQAIEDGRKIEAIKLYREATGVGLARAKGAVEDLMPDQPSNGPGAARPVKPSSGCLGMVACVIVAASIIVW